jgi:hypothetical protein
MATQRCPSCQNPVFPGDVACRKCGYDFILGKHPKEFKSGEERQRMLAVAGAGVAALLLVAGVVWLYAGGGGEDAPAETHPCVDALGELQPLVQAAAQRGNPIPDCADTPPAPVDCWDRAGVAATRFPTDGRLRFRLTRTKAGFDIECRTDGDGDGIDAIWKANEQVPGVKISEAGTR